MLQSFSGCLHFQNQQADEGGPRAAGGRIREGDSPASEKSGCFSFEASTLQISYKGSMERKEVSGAKRLLIQDTQSLGTTHPPSLLLT